MKRELATVTYADIAPVYHHWLGLVVTFELDEDETTLAICDRALEAGYVVRFMGAIGIEKLRDAIGKSCWVTHENSRVVKVEPLRAADGTPFDIPEWEKWAEARYPNGIEYEELTGVSI